VEDGRYLQFHQGNLESQVSLGVHQNPIEKRKSSAQSSTIKLLNENDVGRKKACLNQINSRQG